METNNNFKWIVFKTTNTVNKKYYIGVHYTDITEFDGYLGSGIWIDDPYTYQFSKTALQQAVKEFGVKRFNRTTISIHDNENEAIDVFKLMVTPEIMQYNKIYNNFIYDDSQQIYIFAANGGRKVYFKMRSKFKFIESAFSGCCFKGLDSRGNNLGYFYCSFVDDERYDRARKFQIQRRKVYKFDAETGLPLDEYDHQEDAEAANKKSNITKSIKLKTPDKNGFTWTTFKCDLYNVPDQQTLRKIWRRKKNNIKFAESKAKRRARLAEKLKK